MVFGRYQSLLQPGSGRRERGEGGEEGAEGGEDEDEDGDEDEDDVIFKKTILEEKKRKRRRNIYQANGTLKMVGQMVGKNGW